METKNYDYIFLGCGLATLSIINKIIEDEHFSTKKILILERESKNINDRTWCFWNTNSFLFDEIIHQKWDTIIFKNETFTNQISIKPYSYQLIQSIDFYTFMLKKIDKCPNIEFGYEEVTGFEEATEEVWVTTKNNVYKSSKLFNSIHKEEKNVFKKHYPHINQHFLGWFIQTNEPTFDPTQAVFMDFSVAQKGSTRFMYVLPFTKTEALIEYTLFSKKLLQIVDYEIEIKNYLQKLGIENYTITHTEFGNIPMTTYPFWEQNTANILHIGTAGGWTKASTGFTFANTQKQTEKVINLLKNDQNFGNFYKPNRFYFYDSLLLLILEKQNEKGKEIFSKLFKTEKNNLVLQFLDEKTTLFQEIQLIMRCPKRLFLRALIHFIRQKLKSRE